MSDTSWTDQIVGARMTVDQEFSSRIADSRFSNQQWSLIMTATEFEIEQPADPESARIVANTENVEQIIPELENIPTGMGAMGGGPGGQQGGSSSGGILDSILGAFGLGGDGDDNSHAEQERAAESLTQEYAEQLQAELESKGRWDTVRQAAASEQ
ncbi:DUF5799 family protein [Natronorubrum daqingense]|uniref:Uncharacterized protein n=1 Tax=Natronorubrum daqingense TaxID=588898 RepID=A0A1N7C950_9EURY|nr:DUF5799 family protein [Natronorubrum daqingense]APX96798.1 hypothetical protein BB347_09290 [Natronorubrum daqingense]SIR60102.1 hypothetical protein SAMN05421809_1581 [Natronorubrum daqingense]